MQNASAELRQLLSGARAYPGKLRVTFGIIDPELVPDATITATSETYFSNVKNIISGVDMTNTYNTLEPNAWILGNGGETLPSSGWKYPGLTSSVVSNDTGTFSANPKITITTSNIHSIAGLTGTFDRFRNNWADMIIRIYRNNVLLDTYSASPTEADFEIAHPFDEWNKMEIEFTKTSIPYRRIRITSLEFGIYRFDETFDKASFSSEVSPISEKLPIIEFNWTLFNFSKEFKPGQETGMQKYLMEQQPIKFEWGYPLSDGTIEWFLGGNLLTSGTPKFPRDRVELKATDTLSYCTDIYNKGIYKAAGTSLYDLAESVLLDASLPLNADGTRRWRLWDGLKLIKTTAPLPKKTGRECLQLIANAGGCVFIPDREGNIVIDVLPTVQHDFKINYGLQTSKSASIIENPPLYSVVVGVGSYILEASTELAKVEQYISGTTTLRIEYAESTSISATITGGTIVSAQYYAAYAEIVVSGTGNIVLTINGRQLTRSEWQYEKIYGLTGEILPFENVLCTNATIAGNIAKTVGDFYVKRSIYNADFIGHPLLDSLDRIWVENDFDSETSGLVIKHTLEYNGAWKGSLKWSR